MLSETLFAMKPTPNPCITWRRGRRRRRRRRRKWSPCYSLSFLPPSLPPPTDHGQDSYIAQQLSISVWGEPKPLHVDYSEHGVEHSSWDAHHCLQQHHIGHSWDGQQAEDGLHIEHPTRLYRERGRRREGEEVDRGEGRSMRAYGTGLCVLPQLWTGLWLSRAHTAALSQWRPHTDQQLFPLQTARCTEL